MGTIFIALNNINLKISRNLGLLPYFDRKLKVYKKPEIKKKVLAAEKIPSTITRYFISSITSLASPGN